MYILGVIIVIICSLLVIELHARMVFLARAYRRRYGHGKSWKRAHKHYKSNWTIFERLLWIHAFKEWYERKYRIIAVLSYVHFVFAFITICISCISLVFFPNSKLWVYDFILYSLFFASRFVYDNAIATEK